MKKQIIQDDKINKFKDEDDINDDLEMIINTNIKGAIENLNEMNKEMRSQGVMIESVGAKCISLEDVSIKCKKSSISEKETSKGGGVKGFFKSIGSSI